MSSNDDQLPDNPSPWKIWRHPRQFKKHFDTLNTEIADLRARLQRSEKDRHDLTDEIDALKSNLAKSNDQIARDDFFHSQQVAALEGKINKLQKEIKEWQSVQKELEEMASKVEEWNKLKEDYEKRIKTLSTRLENSIGINKIRDAKIADFNGSDIIDAGESPFVDPAPKRRRRRTLPTDDTDWLLPLPEE